MNKLTKAAIAGAAGIALLLGGAGSLAYWNDSATLSGAQIEAGTLSIAASGNWSGEPNLWVPGDEAVYSGSVTINATGDNLKAELTLDESSLALTGDLADALEIDFTADLSGLTTVTGADGVYTVTSSSTAIEIPVTVTVSLPFGDDVDNSTQGGTADLSGIDFLLTQVANS
jgi:alternate signal-mediated exported protein